MNEQVIELLKMVAGSTETLVIWYMVLHFLSDIVQAVSLVAGLFFFGKGAAIAWHHIQD